MAMIVRAVGVGFGNTKYVTGYAGKEMRCATSVVRKNSSHAKLKGGLRDVSGIVGRFRP